LHNSGLRQAHPAASCAARSRLRPFGREGWSLALIMALLLLLLPPPLMVLPVANCWC
jgi:hypothetical protein